MEKNGNNVVNKRLVIFSLWSSVFWLMFVPLFGFLLSIKFLYPDFLGNHFTVTWGTLRVLHVNGVIFAWWLTAAMGLVFYMVPRLAGRKLWAEQLAWATIVGWNIMIFLSVVTLALGFNQGIELGEMVWPIDVGIVIVLVMFAVVCIGTIIKRAEPMIYVSLWYIMAGVVWTALNYALGNFGLEFIARGPDSANLHGFYLHNLVGLTITPLGVAIAYYFLPVAAKQALYSHKLSIIGFWTIAFCYPFSGAHHYIFSPISHWVQTVAIAFSVMLILPVVTVVFNLFATMKGKWGEMIGSAPLKYLVLGNLFYLLTCLQGPFQSLRTVQTAVHYTDWVIGHAHLAILGTFTFWAFGAIYLVWPKVTGKEPDARLMNWQFWIVLTGAGLMVSSLTIGGLIQGAMWRDAAVPFIETVKMMWPYWFVRAIAGLMLLIGFYLFAFILITARKPATGGRQ